MFKMVCQGEEDAEQNRVLGRPCHHVGKGTAQLEPGKTCQVVPEIEQARRNLPFPNLQEITLPTIGLRDEVAVLLYQAGQRLPATQPRAKGENSAWDSVC